MDYEEFCEYMKTELPLNRKERFYTGTVLPSILFHNGLTIFYAFLKNIQRFPIAVNESDTKDNFLFYTEYNLKESAGPRSVGERVYVETKETPDVMIEILKPQRVFVVIEAKMFSKLSDVDLARQMAAQDNAVVKPLQEKYSLEDDHIFRVALVPRASGLKGQGTYQVMHWEFFFERPEFRLSDCPFLNYLKFALDNYEALVQATGWELPAHVECQLRGEEVYHDGKNDQNLWIGRKGGRTTLARDIRTGKWRKQKYCCSSLLPTDGITGQWISSAEFAEMVDNHNMP